MSRQEVQAVIDAFADAVQAGDARAMCRLLIGRASEMEGCGTDEMDINPQIQLAIDRRADIRLTRVSDTVAEASFPGYRPPAAPDGSEDHGPQQMTLINVGNEWKISDLHFSAP